MCSAQFGLEESHVGVVQYSGAKAQEVVKLGDPNIRDITSLKQYVDFKQKKKTLHRNFTYFAFKEFVCIYLIIVVFYVRAIKELRWLAEATYTGEALEFSWNNMINQLGTNHSNSVVLVLTDGRSDTSRDNVPLNVLCGRGLQVRAFFFYFLNLLEGGMVA